MEYQLYKEKNEQIQNISTHKTRETARQSMLEYAYNNISLTEHNWELNSDDSISVFKKRPPRKITYTEFLLSTFCFVTFNRDDDEYDVPIEMYRISEIPVEDI